MFLLLRRFVGLIVQMQLQEFWFVSVTLAFCCLDRSNAFAAVLACFCCSGRANTFDRGKTFGGSASSDWIVPGEFGDRARSDSAVVAASGCKAASYSLVLDAIGDMRYQIWSL